MLEKFLQKLSSGAILDDVAEKLFIGAVGAIAAFALQRSYRWVVELRAPFTGQWKASIYDETGALAKQDIWTLRQRGDSIKGKIARTIPQTQNHRQWTVTGTIRGQHFFGVFFANSADIPSFGSWHLRQVDDDRLEGFYLSLQRTISNSSKTLTEELGGVRLILERERSR